MSGLERNENRMLTWRGVREAGMAGALVWSAYGLMEFLFLNCLNHLVAPAYAWLSWWHWQVSIVALALYMAAGLGLGVAAHLALGLLRVKEGPGRLARVQALALLSILVVYAWHLGWYRGRTHGANAVVLALAGMAALAVAYSALRGEKAGWLGRLCNPWGVSALLVSLPWILDQVREGAGLAFPAVVAAATLAAWLAEMRFTPRPHPVKAAGVTTAAVLVGAVALVTLAQQALSPRLPEVAVTATKYANPLATSNFTLPTHATLFTGLYPRRHGAQSDPPRCPDNGPLDASFVTLAERLGEAGYRTMGFSANSAFVTPDFGLDQGFQVFRCPKLPANEHLLWRIVRRIMQRAAIRELERTYISGADLNARIRLLLRQAAERTDPFFLFVNYMEPHASWVPDPEDFAMFDSGAGPLTYAGYCRIRDGVSPRRPNVDARSRQAMTDLYDACLRSADRRVGELLDELRRSGAWDDTLVIVVGDHGEGLGEHSVVEHARFGYQNQLFVPLLIKYPGQQAPREVTEWVSLTDVYPTVLAAAGLSAGGAVDGRSLPGLEDAPRPAVFAEIPKTPRGLHWPRATAVVSGEWKLLAKVEGAPELYNLREDPAEEHDLAPANQPKVEELLGILDAWSEATPRYEGASKPLSPGQIERLRGLGYLQ